MPVIFCLDCDRQIEVGAHPKVGHRIRCPHCETRLEVIDTDPLKLDWTYDGPVTKFNLFDDWPKPSTGSNKWA